MSYKTKQNQTKRSIKKSTLSPSQFIHKAQPIQELNYVSKFTFDDLNINPTLRNNLKNIGFSNPTEIQEKTINHLISNKNLVGIANTGTGKTGAFLIPIINQLLNTDREFKTLIIVPTRELALQIHDEFNKMTKGLKFKANCHIGGTNISQDLIKARKPAHLIIGTPGRLLDLNERRALSFNNIEKLVLDEFDRMLDMGFINSIRSILGQMKVRNHTMLFSATVNASQENLINEIVKNPIKIELSNGNTSASNVQQDIIKVAVNEDKYKLLLGLVKKDGFEKVILFTETKRLADKLSKKLNNSGIKSDQIHGNKSQNYRVNALAKFKNGQIKVLVATDVAARGVDVNDVSHVINYQQPMDYDTYIHRIGRTGRAGKAGTAYTFIDA